MDWTSLLVAFIGAFGTICAGGLGALATVAAAMISKMYLNNRVKDIKNIVQPDKVTTSLFRVFDFFRISEAFVFKVDCGASYIDSNTELVISVHQIASHYSAGSNYISQENTTFVYQLPQQGESLLAEHAALGWRKLLKFQGDTYALTIVAIEDSYEGQYVKFDFRKVTKVVELMS